MRERRSFLYLGLTILLGSQQVRAAEAPASQTASDRPIPVVFDTDIGGDIDDTWALAFLLASPELDLKLVVTAVENTPEKARIVARLLERAGRTDVPVGIGIKGSDKPTNQAEWVKDYDLGSYTGKVHQDGVQAMIDVIMRSERLVTLIAVGPVPNVAEALRREPRIAERARLVVMGGSIDHRRRGVDGPFAEYNVRADAKAARAAYGASWDVTMTPLDTAGTVVLRGDIYARVRDAETPLARAIMENYRAWAKVSRWSSPDAPNSRSSTLFDTVAVYLAFANDFCNMQEVRVRVTDEGHTVRDPQGKPTHVALTWKDQGAFKRLLVDRIVGYTCPSGASEKE